MPAEYTVTTRSRNGETLGASEYPAPEQVTRHLLTEMEPVHRTANSGKVWTVTHADGRSWDSEQWLWSRPADELDPR
jgi:uncharacterized tellurite resistance protein B-like protein